MIEAHLIVEGILMEEKKMWDGFVAVWEKSRFEKGRSVNGKDYVHIMDDVKDHFADRRKGLDYMLAPVERMNIEEWQNKLWGIIKEYAKKNSVEISGIPVERLED
jgi:competence protein ComGF